ncbi:MAG: glycosyltransferase [Opitutaceae bacterium]|nr:glycosyltransferase [Opitutaceae bacterium]
MRVFVPTFRRLRLLERALASLRAQKLTDWICEVHNDAPDDPAPAELVARLADARISYRPHPRNLGGTETFNLFFRAASEPFYAMLEDDNAWQPDFLRTMLSVAREHPDVTVFWSNQRVWQEERDGVVRDTGRFVHPDATDAQPRRIQWGQPAQMCGALHAHSAALFRSRAGNEFRTPNVPIAVVEPFRERLLPHPMVFVPQPLADFTQTQTTARSGDRGEWAVVQTMLAATFLRHASYPTGQICQIFRHARSRRPPTTSTLLMASLMDPACRALRAHAHAVDWLRLARSSARWPRILPRVLRSRREHADWWEFLDRATAVRFAEQRPGMSA